MNVSQPVASQIGSVSFRFLTSDEVRNLSVKRIENSETFDTLLNPTPGALYDTALGAWGDHGCSTCYMNAFSCPGHPGHIELPVPIYHVSFMPQMLKLLNAQCAFCSGFRLARSEINRFVCKFQLLDYGLVKEVEELENISAENIGAGSDEDDSQEDELLQENLIERRNKFVRRAIKTTGGKTSIKFSPEKVESIAVLRRDVIQDFFASILRFAICASCKGFSPKFRRDKFNKVFRKPLPEKQRAKNAQLGKKRVNYLLQFAEAKRREREEKLEDRIVDEGIVADIDSPTDVDDDLEITDVNGPNPEDTMKGKQGRSKAWSTKGQEYCNPDEVFASLATLFEKEQDILSLVYNSRGSLPGKAPVTADMYFLRNLLVPPNKFRPPATARGTVAEAQQNVLYKKILNQCQSIDTIRREIRGEKQSLRRQRDFVDLQNACVALQDAVNSLFDSDRNPIQGRSTHLLEEGIKQKLEKKEGLFRKNMMGKRVNFAARSVISPDPNIETNEIGVPPVFAKKLTYPEPVTNHNFYDLKEAVLNGPTKWPGAAAVENENGQIINLRNKSFDERQALANQLLAPSSTSVNGARNKKVHRHLNNGDIVIMNRQPTLHKPSMMCHRARILPGEKTIRMHYANCNTYNADFDGDEMNLHFPQNENARAEAMLFADTDHQYLVATAGKPLRGLIQDHVSMGVWLTNRDTLFTRAEYQELLYSSLRPENDHTLSDRIETVDPAILKPRAMWTGKQVITTILKNITKSDCDGLTMTGQSSTPKERWGEKSEEGEVVFQNGEFICGILDKGHLGPAAGGFVHSIYEVYGHTVAGKLLSILGRLLTRMLSMRAFSCGMEDIVLTEAGNAARLEKLKSAEKLGQDVASRYVTLENVADSNNSELRARLEDVLRDDSKQAGLDSVYNARTADFSSQITKTCLPNRLFKPYPHNQMQLMTSSGAKGSSVQPSLISCNLGQQVLEGRRVPIMVSGKSLPSFKPYETELRAGGYVTDRFLTGVRPQSYYFHAMAGREGLIDTAVKTSRSGYLQRCVIKGMEGLKVEYDTSVRDSDGSLVQFLYGEDGLEVTKQKHLKQFQFTAENFVAVAHQIGDFQGVYERVSNDAAFDWQKKAMKLVKKTGRLNAMDPVTARFNPGSTLGCTSESFALALKNYIDQNPQKLIKNKKVAPAGKVSKKGFTALLNMKYMKSVVDPGEAVGIVAGQSIGEPSTQMTLNTFHLAGHSAKNVTLGIPRLREILMTASTKIQTPTMTLPLRPEVSEETGQEFARNITKLTLAEVVDSVSVSENIGIGIGLGRARIYRIRLNLFPSEEYEETYGVTIEQVALGIEAQFIPLLVAAIKKDLKAKGDLDLLAADQPEVGKAAKQKSNPKPSTEEDADETKGETAEGAAAHDQARADVDTEDEDDPDDDATQFKRKNRGANAIAYDDPEIEEEEAIAAGAREESVEPEDAEQMEDEGYGGSPRGSPIPSQKDDEAGQHIRDAADERKERVLADQEHLADFAFDELHGAWCELTFEYDIATSKILMLNHVESACLRAVIRSVRGLGACTYVAAENKAENSKPHCVLTEGVNLAAMRDHSDVIDPNAMITNDIAAVLLLYGVEAARKTIIEEMDAVFKGHSISVDNRHLNLIADYMTRNGGFTPFSRHGFKNNVSPFAKMSFETTVGFLKDAVAEGDLDDLKGPSARIVAGRLSGVGTGAFEVFTPVNEQCT